MAKLHADKLAGCVSHTKFTPADVARLEARAAALKETHEFDDENHAYAEAALRIAAESRSHHENILGALTREDAAKAKDKAREPIAAPVFTKHDNVPDLADAVAKENGFPQAVAEAYVQHVELGRSLTKIAATLGVGKSTAAEFVQKMRPLMDEAKPARLEVGAVEPAAAEHVAEPTTAAEEPAPDQRAADVNEEEHTEPDNTPAEELTASGDVADEDNQASGQGPRDEGTNVNISDAPHGEGETKAKNDEAATKQYGRVAKEGAQARWDALDNGAPKSARVAWSELGPGQKAGFADEVKKGKAAEAYASISAMHQEGIKLVEAQDFLSDEVDGKVAGVDKLTTVEQMVGPKLHVLQQKFPALFKLNPEATIKSASGSFTYHGFADGQAKVMATALHNLLRSSAGNLVRAVMPLVDSFGAFDPTSTQGKTGAAYLHSTDRSIVVFNKNFIFDEFDPRPPVVQLVQMVHELTHVADSRAGEALTGGRRNAEATLQKTAPTSVSVNYTSGSTIDFKLNDVAREAYDAYAKDPELWKDLRQSMHPLFLETFTLEQDKGAMAQDDEHYMTIADNASTELSPKLVELYLTAPALLKRLPLAYAYADRLAHANNIHEAANILGGTNASTSDFHTPATGRRNDRLSEQVPRDAADGRAADGERVRAVAAGERQERKDRAGAAGQGQDQGGNSGLNVPPPITGGAGVTAWIKAQFSDKVWRNHPGLLGWLSTEQLADRWKDLPLVKAFSDTMRKMDGRSTQVIAQSDRHSTQWSALRKRHGPKTDQNFGQLLLDATTANTWPDRALTDAGNKHLDAKDAGVQAEHEALARAYKNLPAAYQTLFNDIVADKAAQREATVAGLRKGIVSAYYPEPGKGGLTAEQIDAAAALKPDARDAFAKSNVKSATDDKALKSLWSDIDAHKENFPGLAGPYFPKMRFGDHVVSWKSGDYQAQERAVAHANEQVQQLLSAGNYQPITELEGDLRSMESRLKRSTRQEHREMLKSDIAAAKTERESLLQPIAAARKLLADQQNKLMNMKADAAHYGVEFYENRALAMVNEERLRAHFGTGGTAVSRELKDQFLRQMDGVTPAFMRTLEDKMSSSLSGVDAAKVRDAMRELYLRLQPENSALKRQLKRANVSGVRYDEAQRAYALSSLHAAHSISRLEHGNKLHEHINELRFNAPDEDAKLLGNELGKRIAQNMAAPDGLRALSMMANATYLSYLGMSPSFMVTQITQPWVISAPIMAGRHGVRTTGKLLARAGVDAAKLLKGSFDADKRWKYHLDPQVGVEAGIINADEAKMLQELMDHGRIDITITHDLGATSAGANDGPIATAAAIASYPAQQLEMANRVSTALAGYRAERAKGTPHLEAMQYADTLVADTHLNYAASNRARLMHPNSFGGWGRVMFQFRAYQQGMLYLIYKNMVDGARGNPEARKSLAYLAGMQLATGGVAAMPMPGVMAVAIGLLYKAFTDDDDEKDLKEMLYQGVKSVVGDTGATAVMKGIPAALGVDVSSKVGMGNIAEAVPYADERAKGKDIVKDYFAQLVGGPAVGMAMNWAEALKSAGQGDFLKATAQAAPAALAGPLKAYGYASQGLTDSRGNTVLGADEMGAADAVVKALGFQPTEVQRVQDQRRAYFEARGNRNDARAKLLAEYAHARLNGGDTATVREEVAGFNERHPDDRINAAQLEKSVAAQRVRERSMRHGIPVGRHDKALAAEMGIE